MSDDPRISTTTTSEDQSEYEYCSNTILLDMANTLYDKILKWPGEKTIASVVQMEQDGKESSSNLWPSVNG